MEYVGLVSGPPPYDLTDVEVTDVSAAMSENRPYFVGSTPVAITCAVARQGSRDLAPPKVDRTPAELAQLSTYLAVSYPGAIVPTCSAEALSDKVEARVVDRANKYLRALVAHGELGTSKKLLYFLLRPTVSDSMYSAKLPGSDVSMSATTGRMTGSIADDADEEVPSVLAWAKEKEKLLDAASARAVKAKVSLDQAVRDCVSLLESGGILVDAAFGEGSGLDALVETLADEKALLVALKTAASHVTTLYDRLTVSRQILETTKASFDKRELAEKVAPARRTNVDSYVLATASTKQDVNAAQRRVDLLAPALDAARKRFHTDARDFVRDFPRRFTLAIDALVDRQIAAADAVARALDTAKRQIVSSDEADDFLSAKLAAAPTRLGTAAKDGCRDGPDGPDFDNGKVPTWAKDDKPTAGDPPSTNKPKPATNSASSPAWVDEKNDQAPPF